MRAGIVTLRLGPRLVGIRCDTPATLELVRERFAAWIDDQTAVADWALDLQLESVATTTTSGPRTVPQLRLGATLLARSRSADEVVDALAGVLGGIAERYSAARTSDDRRPGETMRTDDQEEPIWLWLRPFVANGSVVLVDARGPTLTNDAVLARSGIDELAAWSVEFEPDGCRIRVPAALDGGGDGGSTRRFRLVGIVGVDPAAPLGDAAHLVRYAARHGDADWYRAIRSLVEAGRVRSARDTASARRLVAELHAAAD